MHRFRMIVSVILTAALSFVVWANDVNTGGQRGIIRTLSSYTLGETGLHAGGSFRFATELEYVAGTDGVGDVEEIGSQGTRTSVSRENPYLFTGDIFCAYLISNLLIINIYPE